jgi:hypothetical protein
MVLREVLVDVLLHIIWVAAQLLHDGQTNVEHALYFLKLHSVLYRPWSWWRRDFVVHPFSCTYAKRSKYSRID